MQRDSLMIYPGVMSISAVLKSAGHECDILIENLERDLVAAAVRSKPDIIGISCTTSLHSWTKRIVKRVRERMNVPIVVGGPHPTFYSEMIDDSGVGIICIGEGEYALLELMESLEQGKDITHIRNLWVKDNGGEIHKNPLRPPIQDLDELPFMDRELYRKYKSLRAYEHSQLIMTGRGCPYSCSFCFNRSLREMYDKTGGRYVRRRTVDNVINEIRTLQARYDVRKILFLDDTFILDREWVLSFLESYRDLVALPFSCLVRADLINEPIVRALKDAGCFFVRMGIESGNEDLRNRVLNRRMTSHQVRKAAHLVKRHGIRLSTNSILGIPGETIETALETVRINLDIHPDFAWCSLMQPYPGTQILDYARVHGFLRNNFTSDDIDQSYYFSTPIQMNDKTAIMNLQKFFSICVAFPFLVPAVRRLVEFPSNAIFDLIFKLHHAYGTFMTREIDLLDFIQLGIHAKSSFHRGVLSNEDPRIVSSGDSNFYSVDSRSARSKSRESTLRS
jgi:anaerobic magnesium-protoporphyrin IX monomethyl ester cyclase